MNVMVQLLQGRGGAHGNPPMPWLSDTDGAVKGPYVVLTLCELWEWWYCGGRDVVVLGQVGICRSAAVEHSQKLCAPRAAMKYPMSIVQSKLQQKST